MALNLSLKKIQGAVLDKPKFTPLTELHGTLQRDKSVADLRLSPIVPEEKKFTPIKDLKMSLEPIKKVATPKPLLVPFSVGATRDISKAEADSFSGIDPTAFWAAARVEPKSSSEKDIKTAQWQTGLNIVPALIGTLISPVIDVGATIHEVGVSGMPGGDPTGQGTKFKVPLLGGAKLEYQGAQSYYATQLNSGASAKQAFWNTALKLGWDMSIVVPVGMALGRMALLKSNPELFLKEVQISRQNVSNLLSGREASVPKEIAIAYKGLSNAEKVSAAKGLMEKYPTATPSTLGKIFGITEDNARIIYNQVMKPKPPEPFRPNAYVKQPAYGLSVEDISKRPGAVPKGRAIVPQPPKLTPETLVGTKDTFYGTKDISAVSKIEIPKVKPQELDIKKLVESGRGELSDYGLEFKTREEALVVAKEIGTRPSFPNTEFTTIAKNWQNEKGWRVLIGDTRNISVKDFLKAPETLIPKDLQPLAEEARKSRDMTEFFSKNADIFRDLIPKLEKNQNIKIGIGAGKTSYYDAMRSFYQAVKPEAKGVKAGVPKERALVEVRGEEFILKGVPETKGMKPETRVRREVSRILKERDYDKIVGSVKSAKEILDRRRLFIRAVQKQFGLSDADLKTITRQDIRLMSNIEFKEFLDKIRDKSEEFAITKQARNVVEAQIIEKEFDIEPLRKAMKLPSISNMSLAELEELDRVLTPYVKGDVFLSKRKLETIERTELSGIKTYREAREILAKKLGVKPEELNNIKISEFDRFKGESGLAEKDPFFRMMVEETARVRLIREAEFLEMEKELNSLARRVKTTLGQKLIPQQKNIRKWFEATDKSTVSLTSEELAVVEFMQGEWIKARDYLVKMEAMKKGIKAENYFTHIRRGILEAVKEDGIIQAVKEVFHQYKLDEQAFDILDTQTGEVLAMDKFFRFALHRGGQLRPTENIIEAFRIYMRTFKKKQALDEIVPLIDIYAHALTPKGTTKEGLLLHGNLVRFVKEWLNTQKGRRITVIAKQGGKIDWTLRALRSFTTLMDIGLNIPVSVATQVGEQAITYQLLGGIKYFKAKLMALTPKGKRITNKYRSLIGKNPWTELMEPARDISDRLMDGIFALFKDANVRRNRNFILGSLTKMEWATETISPERLAHLRTELSRYGVVGSAGSIIGATPEAGLVTQYKTWAIPILGSISRNLKYLSKYIGTFGKSEKFRGKRAFLEFIRLAEFIGGVFILKAFMSTDEDDDSMIGKIKRRFYQEATTLLQAIDPKLYSGVPRMLSWINDMGSAISSIVKLEEYEQTQFGKFEKGELKGVRQLKQMLTPRAIKQFEKDQQKEVEDIREQINKELESGELTIDAAKEKIVSELKKLETAQKNKRFELPLDKYKEEVSRLIEEGMSTEDAKKDIEAYLKKKPDVLESKDEKTFIQKVVLYAKAIGTDPLTAIDRILTGQIIRRIDSGAIIIERIPFEESQAIRSSRGATKEMILDHTIPLELGGSNKESNLKLVSVEEWERYTIVENYLGDKLREGLINKKEAQRLIKDFKEGKIKEEDIIK